VTAILATLTEDVVALRWRPPIGRFLSLARLR
jgi:hypothetical protein